MIINKISIVDDDDWFVWTIFTNEKKYKVKVIIRLIYKKKIQKNYKKNYKKVTKMLLTIKNFWM